MLKPLAGLLLASALLLTACSSDGDPDSAPSPADESLAPTDLSAPSSATGGGGHSSAVIVEDPNSSASASISQVCLSKGTGQVTIRLSGYEAAASTVINAKVGSQSIPIEVNDDGAGTQFHQGRLDGPTKVTIPLPGSGELATELPGC